jgi:hypothetical protein
MKPIFFFEKKKSILHQKKTRKENDILQKIRKLKISTRRNSISMRRNYNP